MITIVPDYYSDFVCKAGDCRHTCCRDWEICIDAETAEKYRSLGKEMEGKADLTPGAEKMIPLPSGECPFLLASGLCELILTKGEDALCQICRDHPRFRKFHDDHVEMGLGLRCEKAGELLFSGTGHVTYRSLSGEDPWDEAKKVTYRVKELLRKMDSIPDGEADPKSLCGFLLTLEHLDDAWTGLLKKMDGKETSACAWEETEVWKDRFLRLKEYLAFRHGEKRSPAFLAFCFRLCKEVLKTMTGGKEPQKEDLEEAVRMFSSEIEYSEENMERIEEKLGSGKRNK